MGRVSIIIPARNEECLQRTIDSILQAARGDIEVIPILDGYKPELKEDSRVKPIYLETTIGQRAGINLGAKNATGKHFMKCDAHCSFGNGFDEILKKDCEKDWTVLPRMYNLHIYNWKCKYGCTMYQNVLSPDTKDGICPICKKQSTFVKDWVWQIRKHRRTDYMYFDKDLRVKYWRAFKNRPESQGKITDVMNGVGACWFMHMDRFWELGGMDEDHGSWGQVAVEVACKAWLSGGRHVVNKNTWFAHLFRTTNEFSFPYKQSGRAQENARKYSRDLWYNNKWPKQTRELNWLINKFSPIPSWENSTMNSNDMTILYYTANKIPEKLAGKVKDQIKFASNGIPIVSVSQKPLTDMGKNICVGDIGQSLINIYKQILIAAKEAKTKYIVCCEDDALYVPEHFTKRPPDDTFLYNLNRWSLHTERDMYTLRRRTIMSQCICNRELLIKCLEERLALPDIPKKLCGEPGIYEKQLGLPTYKYDTFETKEPNVVIAHENNTTGIKYVGKDTAPKTDLAPWGNGKKLLDAIYFGDEKKRSSVDYLKQQVVGKRSQFSYIKNKTFLVKDIIDNRMDFCDPRKKKSLKWFMEVFPPFIKSIHEGKEYKTHELIKLPYYEYLLSKLNPADRVPRLTNKGKRHCINLMKDAVKVYKDIKQFGLKAPLDMFWENNRLVLHRGGRRVEILKLLGVRKVPARIFKTRKAFRDHNPSKSWRQGKPDSNSIHDLAIKQFMALGDMATDKYWVHGYTQLYDKEFAGMRNKRIKLLEIGVKRGASLELWKDAFPRGKIYGMDIQDIKIPGFEIFVGEQQDTAFLNNIVQKVGKFDIIIDDGSHKPKHQKASFEALWPHITPQGIYVIEDLHWNYRADKDKCAINTLKDMVDRIYKNPDVASVNFYYNICFIRKN